MLFCLPSTLYTVCLLTLIILTDPRFLDSASAGAQECGWITGHCHRQGSGGRLAAQQRWADSLCLFATLSTFVSCQVPNVDQTIMCLIAGSFYLVFEYVDHDLMGLLDSQMAIFTEIQVAGLFKQLLQVSTYLLCSVGCLFVQKGLQATSIHSFSQLLGRFAGSRVRALEKLYASGYQVLEYSVEQQVCLPLCLLSVICVLSIVNRL